MTSINTNLSSLIVQKNLTKSTNALNQAVERLTTGFKINHASDNAANYSISESMTSKLSSYMVAEENTSMGLDLIRTQSSTLDTIQNLTTRLRALAEQAHNGTYGAQSLEAINQEANAIIDEITRIGNNAEYNGIKLFDNALSQAGIPQLKSNGLMQEIEQRDTSGMTKLADVDETETLAQGTYSISSAEELAKLATMQNGGKITAGSEFVLGADIDLSAYSDGEGWTAIGNSNAFSSTFDGNGYTISNMYMHIDMTSPDTLYGKGLFGNVVSATIKNVSLTNCKIESEGYPQFIGCLSGSTSMSSIKNCSVTDCVITDKSQLYNAAAGLLIGKLESGGLFFENCYVSGCLEGFDIAGGMVGSIIGHQRFENCFTDVNLNDNNNSGGFVGSQKGEFVLVNSGSTGDIFGYETAGGIVGISNYTRVSGNLKLENTSFIGNVSSDEGGVQGLLAGSVRMKDGMSVSIKSFYDSFLSDDIGFIGSYESSSEAEMDITDTSSQLQVGVDSTDSSSIKFTTNISLSSVNALRIGGMEGANSLENIDAFISKLSEAQTKLGAIENRLTSTIESIGVNIENLTSSRSTLKDADVAKESSQMIKNQILQQASATLLATANQTPSLALRLLGGI